MRRVPPIVREYFRGAADNEITLRRNVQAFQQAVTTARGAIKLDSLDLRTTVVNHELQIPWFVAPVGSLRSLWPKAEAVAAKVAGEYGTVLALSTVTGTPMEEVAAASARKCWFQLYLCGGREVATRGIHRARRAGFTGLILTIDTAVSGNRVGHARMKPAAALQSFKGLGFGQRLGLLREKLRLAPQMLTHLSWLFSYWADGGMMQFVNVQLDEKGTPMPYADIATQLAASAVTWNDFRWIKEAWGDGPLIVKGVHNAEDAKRAEDSGASAVIWSNHGGRQEDRVPPTLHMVAEEMPKLAPSKIDFMMDGGIRNGKDILIALSYGVKAVGLGRAYVAGLGAGGHAGMRRAFDIIRAELERSMRLVGVRSVDEIRENGASIRRQNHLLGNSGMPEFVF
ncbi:MAG TPA: alpha-hydroxy acid oxidase [Gemmataceae bacterium]|nr:alpha-hydroxy acid oxidase [Gemmataceae bacterium]